MRNSAVEINFGTMPFTEFCAIRILDPEKNEIIEKEDPIIAQEYGFDDIILFFQNFSIFLQSFMLKPVID